MILCANTDWKEDQVHEGHRQEIGANDRNHNLEILFSQALLGLKFSLFFHNFFQVCRGCLEQPTLVFQKNFLWKFVLFWVFLMSFISLGFIIVA